MISPVEPIAGRTKPAKPLTVKNSIVCCGCGKLFSRRTWAEDGVLRVSVNGGKNHYGCEACRKGGWDIMRHAAMLTGLCHQPQEAS